MPWDRQRFKRAILVFDNRIGSTVVVDQGRKRQFEDWFKSLVGDKQRPFGGWLSEKRRPLLHQLASEHFRIVPRRAIAGQGNALAIVNLHVANKIEIESLHLNLRHRARTTKTLP
jgi:hypothetical protein